ncbi:MAG: DEAD/DEAH box helicase [Verrucomicrobiales bacterium]|nr:DEAD/DEAH box helicase [Verrucomicrobiales bacterium]
MPFSSFGLDENLTRAVSDFPAPTPVQEAAIPAALDARDLLAIAPTGSGKTTAFVLPLLQRWLGEKRRKPRPVFALILVPTRELAAQVRDVVQQCSRELPERIKVVSAVGGLSINPQMMALRGGADVVVATPGRLLDLVDRNAVTLSDVQALVLDEADRLLDLGFEEELQRLLSLLPAKRQNLLFSATFPPRVEALASQFQSDPVRIEIESEPTETAAIEQRALRVDKAKRAPLLRHLINSEKWERVLVFVATQYASEHVAGKLRVNGIEALSFHGKLSQGAREEALTDFKISKIKVLVATDLAARGLDIQLLPVVVNYDLPRSPVDYTHRIGRTGRAGESGLAISFVTEESHAHFTLIKKRLDLALTLEEVESFEPAAIPVAPPGNGGIKGRKKSKKDKLREAAARAKGNE